MIYNDHQISESPLIRLDINLISDFGLDYMRLVCLGVTKRLLLFLKEGKRCCHISPSQINQVSERLECYRGQFPSEMARHPRGLLEIKRWKATEFRQFLLYSGIVVLKGIVTDQFYYHFLSLSVAIRIMLESDSEVRQNNLVYAKKLAIYFVQKSIELYGPPFFTCNVHNLIHLYEDVECFKEDLHSISCFKFENHLQALKRYVRQSTNPAAQVVRRIKEMEKTGEAEHHKHIKTNFSDNAKDGCFLLHSGHMAFIQNEVLDGTYLFSFIREGSLQNYFNQPWDSKIFGIYLCSCDSSAKKVKRF